MSRAFLEVLRELRDGASLEELGEQLTAMVQRVRETGRSGKLSYTLIVKPASKGDTHVLMLEDAIAVKTPSLDRGTTILFADDGHALSRKDPRQPELKGLRDVTNLADAKQQTKDSRGA